MQKQTSVNVDVLKRALTNKYAKSTAVDATPNGSGLAALLAEIPTESLAGNASLLSIIRAQQSGNLGAFEQSVLASIDDCAKVIFTLSDLEIEIAQQLRFALPRLAIEILQSPDIPFRDGPSVLTVLDHLVQAMIGWSSGLGKSGERLYDETRSVIEQLRSESTDIASLEAGLIAFLDKEQARITKLEARLGASETGLLRSQQSKNMSANMINQAMAGKRLTADIIGLLQGPWYDSVQLIVLTKGVDSEDWFRACKLTETIIWMYQPVDSKDTTIVEREKQKLYRIVEHLPGEVRELLVALEHSSHATQAALELIESEQIQIMSGQSLAYAEFEPIECEPEHAATSKVNRLLLKKVNAFEPGQWFLYSSDEVTVRIKLVLKLEDVKQLLFTNRNGMKVMQRSFDEVALYLSSGVIKPLNHDAVFSTTVRTHYQGLIEEHARQAKRFAERKAEVDREEQAREEAERIARQEAEERERAEEEAERERRETAKAERLAEAALAAQKSENRGALTALLTRAKELSVGAWLKLPGPDGRLEECKLAVRIAASDKMIFVNRAAAKVGEYTSEQLAQLLVAGQGEIQDEGVEFEDTLERVVSKLRQDRTKSFDDLTGG